MSATGSIVWWMRIASPLSAVSFMLKSPEFPSEATVDQFCSPPSCALRRPPVAEAMTFRLKGARNSHDTTALCPIAKALTVRSAKEGAMAPAAQLIALVPTRGSVAAELVIALVNNAEGHRILVRTVNRESVDVARNRLAAQALAAADDPALFPAGSDPYVFWIDSDAFFLHGTLTLMLHALEANPSIDVLAGLFGPRAANRGATAFRDVSDKNSYLAEDVNFTRGDIVDVELVGLHFILHRVSLLRRLGPAPFGAPSDTVSTTPLFAGAYVVPAGVSPWRPGFRSSTSTSAMALRIRRDSARASSTATRSTRVAWPKSSRSTMADVPLVRAIVVMPTRGVVVAELLQALVNNARVTASSFAWSTAKQSTSRAIGCGRGHCCGRRPRAFRAWYRSLRFLDRQRRLLRARNPHAHDAYARTASVDRRARRAVRSTRCQERRGGFSQPLRPAFRADSRVNCKRGEVVDVEQVGFHFTLHRVSLLRALVPTHSASRVRTRRMTPPSAGAYTPVRAAWQLPPASLFSTWTSATARPIPPASTRP